MPNIKVLVWDLDGTLYQDDPKIQAEITKNVYRTIAQLKNISFSQAKTYIDELYQQFHSFQKTLMAAGADRNWVLSGEWYFESQIKYLKADLGLAKLFHKLSAYRHILATNGNLKYSLKKLEILKLPKSYFKHIITPDIVGFTKPDIEFFQNVLKVSQKKAGQCLMIGDRWETDLAPANALGMKTCIVGKENNKAKADYAINTVYDLESLLL